MENLFIEEKVYQEIKKKLNKQDDYFTLQEMINVIQMVKAGAN